MNETVFSYLLVREMFFLPILMKMHKGNKIEYEGPFLIRTFLLTYMIFKVRAKLSLHPLCVECQ